MMRFWNKGRRVAELPPKRPIVINLSTNVQPAHTALILFTSYNSKEIMEEVQAVIKANNGIIPSNLPILLQKYGEVFTEWEGILIDVEPQKPMIDISRLSPMS